jgi:hypothetical protein
MKNVGRLSRRQRNVADSFWKLHGHLLAERPIVRGSRIYVRLKSRNNYPPWQFRGYSPISITLMETRTTHKRRPFLILCLLLILDEYRLGLEVEHLFRSHHAR